MERVSECLNFLINEVFSNVDAYSEGDGEAEGEGSTATKQWRILRLDVLISSPFNSFSFSFLLFFFFFVEMLFLAY